MNALLIAVVALKDVFAPAVVGGAPTFAARDLSYLHLQKPAEGMDPQGTYFREFAKE